MNKLSALCLMVAAAFFCTPQKLAGDPLDSNHPLYLPLTDLLPCEFALCWVANALLCFLNFLAMAWNTSVVVFSSPSTLIENVQHMASY